LQVRGVLQGSPDSELALLAIYDFQVIDRMVPKRKPTSWPVGIPKARLAIRI